MATADKYGNMVSYIQSNNTGFGSGLCVSGYRDCTAKSRGEFFAGSRNDNVLEPGKRPYHTIIPGFLSQGGRPIGPFGVMGGFVQPQGHLQMVMNVVDFNLNPQASLDAPRWQWTEGKTVEVEPGFPEEIARQLESRGHVIKRVADNLHMGRGQLIWRDEAGVFCGGTEPRTDGVVAAW